MPEGESDASSVERHQRPLTYYQCRRATNRLRRFRNLVIHRENFPIYLPEAPALEQLIPADTPPERRAQTIDSEIDKLIPLVSEILFDLGINTGITFLDKEVSDDGIQFRTRLAKQNRDLLEDYFELPRDRGTARLEFLKFVLRAIDRGLGVLQAATSIAIRRFFNPVVWFANIVRLPIRILEEAGIPVNEASSKVMAAYAWFLRIGMLLIIAFVATKVGVSVPWQQIIP